MRYQRYISIWVKNNNRLPEQLIKTFLIRFVTFETEHKIAII